MSPVTRPPGNHAHLLDYTTSTSNIAVQEIDIPAGDSAPLIALTVVREKLPTIGMELNQQAIKFEIAIDKISCDASTRVDPAKACRPFIDH